MEKVDDEALGLWDYKEIVKKPMWLSLMVENFKNKEYTHFSQFATDFRQMVENCYRLICILL